MAKQTYTQCTLHKNVGHYRPSGVEFLEHTAFIPTQFAKIGRFIKIKIDDKWDDGWKVVHRGITRDEDWVAVHERYAKHWKDVRLG